jgi:hypothetical protein
MHAPVRRHGRDDEVGAGERLALSESRHRDPASRRDREVVDARGSLTGAVNRPARRMNSLPPSAIATVPSAPASATGQSSTRPRSRRRHGPPASLSSNRSPVRVRRKTAITSSAAATQAALRAGGSSGTNTSARAVDAVSASSAKVRPGKRIAAAR